MKYIAIFGPFVLAYFVKDEIIAKLGDWSDPVFIAWAIIAVFAARSR